MVVAQSVIDQNQYPLDEWEDALWTKGYLVIKNVLSPLEIASYLEKALNVPPTPGYHVNSRVRIFEQDYAFVQLLEKEPVLALMKQLLGNNMHVLTQMVHIMGTGTEVLRWHADEIYAPVPEKHRVNKAFPPIINAIHCHYYLVDVPIEMGPTQVIPGSHASCRQPTPQDGSPPIWEGKSAVSLAVEAGDCVLYSNQLWHSGSPNSTNEKRISIVNFFARRFVAQRLYPFVNYQLPKDIFDQCSDAQKILLGAHPIGKIYG